jgi:hypothetical protein
VRAQAADQAATFTPSANNLSARPLTTASVAWTPPPWDTVGERGPIERTPDLGALVREVIARPGWANGHALAFLITGTGHRTADAADKVGGTPPTLTVNYLPELPVGTYARWSNSHPAIGPLTADVEADGYDNLLEYALGLDPATPEHGVTPLTVEATTLTFTYIRPDAVVDVRYQVEWAATLNSSWSGSGVTQQIITDDGVRRIIRAILPKGATGQRFVRLKVTLLPLP